MTNQELKAIEDFADKLRERFPIPQGEDDFTDRMRKIFHQYFWDILAIEVNKARLDWETDVEREAKYAGEAI